MKLDLEEGARLLAAWRAMPDNEPRLHKFYARSDFLDWVRSNADYLISRAMEADRLREALRDLYDEAKHQMSTREEYQDASELDRIYAAALSNEGKGHQRERIDD